MRAEFITSCNPTLMQAYGLASTGTWQEEPWFYQEGEGTRELQWSLFRQQYVSQVERDFAHTWQRFSHKVQAQVEHLLDTTPHDGMRAIVWLDLDMVQLETYTEAELEGWLPHKDEVCTYLGRGDAYHPDTAWIAYNPHHPMTRPFIEALEDVYLSGRVFELDQWHDAWVWDYVCRDMRIPRRSLTQPDVRSGEAVGRSPLAAYWAHLKGPRKRNIEALTQRTITLEQAMRKK